MVPDYTPVPLPPYQKLPLASNKPPHQGGSEPALSSQMAARAEIAAPRTGRIQPLQHPDDVPFGQNLYNAASVEPSTKEPSASQPHKIHLPEDKQVASTLANLQLTATSAKVSKLVQPPSGKGRSTLDHANIDHELEVDGGIALIRAAEEGDKAVVRRILKKGVSIDGQNGEGVTPLIAAASGGHEDVVRLLLKKGAWINESYKKGVTPLIAPASGGHEDVVRLLLEKGARINKSDEKWVTPLIAAASGGHVAVARLLLDKGAWVDRQDSKGVTPLIAASSGGHEGVVRLLLEKGAQINKSDWSKLWVTPLKAAGAGGHENVVQLLRAHMEKPGGIYPVENGLGGANTCGAHERSRSRSSKVDKQGSDASPALKLAVLEPGESILNNPTNKIFNEVSLVQDRYASPQLMLPPATYKSNQALVPEITGHNGQDIQLSVCLAAEPTSQLDEQSPPSCVPQSLELQCVAPATLYAPPVGLGYPLVSRSDDLASNSSSEQLSHQRQVHNTNIPKLRVEPARPISKYARSRSARG